MKASDCWETPAAILDAVRAITNRIDVDPCTSSENPVRAHRYIAPPGDGLTEPWGLLPGELAWLNPPYSSGQIARWIARAAEQMHGVSAHLCVLVPCDPTTAWWARLHDWAAARVDLSSRVRFVDPATGRPAAGARFASTIWYVGPAPYRACAALAHLGYPQVMR